jgi:hypothetical protein
MLYQLSYSPKYLDHLALLFGRYSSTVRDGSGRVPQFKTYGKWQAPRTRARVRKPLASCAAPPPATRPLEDGDRFVRVRRLVVLALLWVGGCGSQPAIVPPPSPARPPAPAARPPAATLFGTVVDGAYKRQSRFELEEGTVYGWRIKLPCTGPTLFRETLQLPGPGDWTVDPALDRSVQVSADKRRAVTEDYSGCYDGWIQHAWAIAASDPPGEYVLTVEVEGYQPQTFRGRFVRAEDAEGQAGRRRSRP